MIVQSRRDGWCSFCRVGLLLLLQVLICASLGLCKHFLLLSALREPWAHSVISGAAVSSPSDELLLIVTQGECQSFRADHKHRAAFRRRNTATCFPRMTCAVQLLWLTADRKQTSSQRATSEDIAALMLI